MGKLIVDFRDNLDRTMLRMPLRWRIARPPLQILCSLSIVMAVHWILGNFPFGGSIHAVIYMTHNKLSSTTEAHAYMRVSTVRHLKNNRRVNMFLLYSASTHVLEHTSYETRTTVKTDNVDNQCAAQQHEVRDSFDVAFEDRSAWPSA